jgi:predicted metal-dependent hydrolase
MSTETLEIRVGGLPVQIARREIKNLHLGVYPPNGRVRVAVPFRVGNEAVRLAVIGKLPWIKRQRARFAAQPRETEREMVSGESHYYLGRRYRLRVVEHDGRNRIVLRSRATLELQMKRGSATAERARVLDRWYRARLRELVPALVAKWALLLDVEVADVRIRTMKTKWGACTVAARRIWLNLELVKKPIPCVEYLVMHELAHLVERHHNDRFTSLMDRHMPQWRHHRKTLNEAPLGHADWAY